MKARYTPGESVLLKIRRSEERDHEAEDRRMMEEVREMSLRDVGIRGPGSYERGVRHRVRDRARDTRVEDWLMRDADGEGARPSTATDAASEARQIGHQSSLRSLLGSSDVDSSGMEEEILRQIMDEGILDGIDLNNIDVSQEDELSERIANAYRQRHGQRSRARHAHADGLVSIMPREQTPGQGRQHRRPSRSPNTSEHAQHSSHPPVSRPHLLEAYPTVQSHRRRTSSETRRQTSPVPSSSGRRISTETQRQAARSATDLSSAPHSSSNRRTRPADLSSSGRRTTDPENSSARHASRDRSSQAPRSPAFRPPNTTSVTSPQASHTAVPSSPRRSDPHIPGTGLGIVISSSQQDHQRDSQTAITQDLRQVPMYTRDMISTYLEPFISCGRCGKQGIQYELHWNCSKCHEGKYNLCLRCYRTGRGCLYWYGFGYRALQRYRSQEPPVGHPRSYPSPHRLEGHRYLPPPSESLQPETSDPRSRSTSNPDSRLQSGPFCSECLKFTPECYWTCDFCNEGEWGFCNNCVNQGRCCTHALLPIAHNDAKKSHGSSPLVSQDTSVNSPKLNSSPLAGAHLTESLYGERYSALTFSTKCNICTYPIPPSTTRFHCPQCHAGDYDIDTTCFHRLVHNGKISVGNGPKGWRRCPNGHRMIIIGFEDSDAGQLRIVVADLVGGHALQDDVNADGSSDWSWRQGQQRQGATVSKGSTGRITAATEAPANDGTPPLLKKYPPNGGVGMHVQALWSWWPQEGANDELAFPKGAEIREAEDINGDWFWGTYCARKGVFPSNYGRVIETIGMP